MVDDNIFTEKFGVDYESTKSKAESIVKGAKYRFTVLSDMLIRLEYSETGAFEDRPTELARFRDFEPASFETSDENGLLTIKTKYFELKYMKEKPFLGRKLAPDEFLKVTLSDTSDKVWYYGHVEARNFKSNTVSLDDMKKKPDLEKGLYSTDGFVALDDSKSLIFNKDGSVGKRSDERVDIYLFMYKKDFGFCLKNYYKLTGYPPLIPRYALGVWWDKNDYYDKENLLDLINKFKKNEIPISVIILNKWKNYLIDNDKKEIIDVIKENNLIPSLKIGFDVAIFGEEQMAFNVFDKAFLEKFFNEIMVNLVNSGFEFFKLNYKDGDLYTLRMINYYIYKYLDSDSKRGLILSRNGLINSHLYPVLDVGETFVNWGTLNFLPEYNSTNSNIGVSYLSFATGGYKEGIEDSELYTRYVQLSTYSPLFRFASKSGKYYKREPWSWDVKTRKIVRDYTTIRYKLIPYLYTEAYKYSKTGLPIVQPLYYRYPQLYDEPTFKNEYYFGTELFVCPITKPKDIVMNRAVVNIFLPNGTWYDFKTGKKFPGGVRHISFYQDDDYPVFAKSGAIIPLTIYHEDDRINDISLPKDMEIQIFPGKSNVYKLYEDDGFTKEYKNNKKYLITAIDYNYMPNNYTVIIRPLEGDTEAGIQIRNYKIRFRNTRLADDVLIYVGQNLVEGKYYLDDTDFVVEVENVPVKEQLSINCKGKDIEIDAIRVINEDIDRIISDLKIPTVLKMEVNKIIFNSEDDIKQKRIAIRKLNKLGMEEKFIKMFLKLLEYVADI